MIKPLSLVAALVCGLSLATTAFAETPVQRMLHLACPNADPTEKPTFCATFIPSAKCNCEARKQPSQICNNLDKLYDLMIGTFGSLERACQFQKDIPTQICVDDWNCYHNGGKDSKGHLCNATGKRC